MTQLEAERPAAHDAIYLRRDVFVCVTEGHGVFLDLERDAYSAVVFDAASDLEPSNVPQSLEERLGPQTEKLIEAGLLTRSPSEGRPVAAADIEPIVGHIFGLDDQRAFGLTGEAAKDLQIGVRDLFDFIAASWKASRDLKTRHIARIVGDVRRRKATVQAPKASIDEVRRLTAIYRRLRPCYPRKYLCLYDSLALVEFMARRRVYPLWVYGVQAQPFGAHCWVQHEELLLNEGTEYAGQFTPIMAV